jgi:MmyB-like transcription regulator ligand binding domain
VTILRRRRERLTPAELGLPPGRRRRTPGLRREEVAELAGLCEVNHPTAGRLSFEGTTLHLHGDPGLVLSVETAAPGSDTTARLARLLDGPPTARVPARP